MELTDFELQKLAEASIQNGKIRGTIATIVLNKLTREDLKKYCGYLREEIRHQQVFVQVSEKMDRDFEKKLGELFENREIVEIINKNLGAGAKIQVDDTIFDLSIENRIKQTIDNLKSEL